MPITESSVDFITVLKFDWFGINMSGNLNWDIIFVNVSVNINKKFLKSVRRLLGN